MKQVRVYSAVTRLAICTLFAAAISVLVANEFRNWIGILLASLGVITAYGLTVARIVESRKDPVIVVVRVCAVKEPTVALGKSPTKSAANEWLATGSTRTVQIELIASFRLAVDGSLHPGTLPSGTIGGSIGEDGDVSGVTIGGRIGTSMEVHQELIAGEECVLLCDASGVALHTIGAYASR